MVLLRVGGHDVVDLPDALQLFQKDGCHRRLDRIEKGGLVPTFYYVGIVARAVGQGYEGVEKPPVPINSACPENAFGYLSGFHKSSIVKDFNDPRCKHRG